MCDCKQDIEKKLVERFKNIAPEAKEHGGELAGYGLVIVGNELQAKPYMAFKGSALYPVKKTGDWKIKKVENNMFFSFCPFCGISLSAEKE